MAELSLHGETSGCKVADKRDGKAKSGTSRSQSACCTVLHSKTINRSNYMVIISRFFFFFFFSFRGLMLTTDVSNCAPLRNAMRL